VNSPRDLWLRSNLRAQPAGRYVLRVFIDTH
jgi:hypothetical protein